MPLLDKDIREPLLMCSANIISECYGFENLDVDLELVNVRPVPDNFLLCRELISLMRPKNILKNRLS